MLTTYVLNNARLLQQVLCHGHALQPIVAVKLDKQELAKPAAVVVHRLSAATHQMYDKAEGVSLKEVHWQL
jgi:hypothetical protein